MLITEAGFDQAWLIIDLKKERNKLRELGARMKSIMY